MVPDKIEVAREVWKVKILEHVMLPKLSRMSFLAFQSSVYSLWFIYIQVCACFLRRRIYSQVNMLTCVDKELVQFSRSDVFMTHDTKRMDL